MKKVEITGCFGFIAGYVVKQLKEKGYYVIGTTHHMGEKPENFDEVYFVDIRDKAGMYSAIEDCDGVIHLAGLLGTSENIRQADIMTEVNIGGALNVLNACDNFKIPCVFIGVGNYQSLNTYSISKTTAERYALMFAENFGTKVNVVRALNAFYPKQKWGKIHKIIPTFVNKALRNEDISIYGGKDNCSVMDMVAAPDVASVLIDVLERTDRGEIKGKVFEAGTGVGYPVWEIAEKIVKLTGSRSKIIEVPMRYGESERSVIVAQDPYPIKYEDFEQALTKTIEYYRGLL